MLFVEQGVRDTSKLYEILQIIFCHASLLPPLQDGLFTVHMAIITANLGKRLFVEEGCLLGYMLSSRLCLAELSPRTEEECNTEIFSILDWKECERICKVG